MAKGFFISAIDTNVGKTVVSAWLTYHFEAYYFKPIQSGNEDGHSDRKTVEYLSNSVRTLPEVYSFTKPISPNLAARADKINIDVDLLVIPNRSVLDDNLIIVEGVGGVMVPITQEFLVLDLMEKFALPVIIVGRTTLGTINHTLLTIESLKKRGLSIAGIIFSGQENQPVVETIHDLTQVPILDVLEPLEPLSHDSIAKRIPSPLLRQTMRHSFGAVPHKRCGAS
jgi:dethiobiotin synthetase